MSVALPETLLTASGGVAWPEVFRPQPTTGPSDALASAAPVRVRQNSTVREMRRVAAQGFLILEAPG
jgi:hypothetical protein